MKNILLAGTLLLFMKYATAQQNIQARYELNDPRNPDCPCHKLQKQAEDEYALLQKKDGVKTETTHLANTAKIVSLPKEAVKRQKRIFDKKHVFKRFGSGPKKLFFKRSRKLKFHIPDYEVCYKW